MIVLFKGVDLIPHTLSPFRYPGGKTQLYSFVKNAIEKNDIVDCVYIEPYSGGFGAGLQLLLNDDVSQVVINDYDRSIYSVWYSILNHTDELIKLIEKTPIDMENWYKQKENHLHSKKYRNSIENGFSTLFLNRTNRSGIINAGPIGGYEQKGNYKLDCRFNKKAIINKIMVIADYKSRITLYQKDTLNLIDIIQSDYSNKSTFIFFDPPYYEQGKNLYTNFYNHSDHSKLAKKIASLYNYHWITTYDYSPQIQDIYNKFPNYPYFYELNYSAQKKRRAFEFIFSSPKTKLFSFDKIKLTSIK